MHPVTLPQHHSETLRSPLPARSVSSASAALIAIVDRACAYVPADKYQSRTRRESRIAHADARIKAEARHTVWVFQAATRGGLRCAQRRWRHPP
jgi:hypothetical protein